MKALFLEYEKSMKFSKLFYNIKKIKANHKAFIIKIRSYIMYILLAGTIGLCSLFLMSEVFYKWENQWMHLFGEIVASVTTIISVVTLIVKLLIPIVKLLVMSSIPLSQKIANNISIPNYIYKLGERENIKNDLNILVNAWIYRFNKRNGRIVLIIDELDRCSEKGIVEFFQSM